MAGGPTCTYCQCDLQPGQLVMRCGGSPRQRNDGDLQPPPPHLVCLDCDARQDYSAQRCPYCHAYWLLHGSQCPRVYEVVSDVAYDDGQRPARTLLRRRDLRPHMVHAQHAFNLSLSASSDGTSDGTKDSCGADCSSPEWATHAGVTSVGDAGGDAGDGAHHAPPASERLPLTPVGGGGGSTSRKRARDLS